MSGPRPLDWPGLMRLGLGRLGLRPTEFWALTPAELLLMLGRGEPVRAGPLDAAGLAALAARFPDKAKGSVDERHRERDAGTGGEP
ncbi:MAG: rcc01693 family protein [Alkalilacustris sp.]